MRFYIRWWWLHTESAVDGKDQADGNKPTAEAVAKATKAPVVTAARKPAVDVSKWKTSDVHNWLEKNKLKHMQKWWNTRFISVISCAVVLSLQHLISSCCPFCLCKNQTSVHDNNTKSRRFIPAAVWKPAIWLPLNYAIWNLILFRYTLYSRFCFSYRFVNVLRAYVLLAK